jgi:hypothetical protein
MLRSPEADQPLAEHKLFVRIYPENVMSKSVRRISMSTSRSFGINDSKQPLNPVFHIYGVNLFYTC